MYKLLTSLILISAFSFCSAQVKQVETQVEIEAGFLSDSIKIGMPVQYYLTTVAPDSIDLIYPDSAYNYGPLTFVEQQYFSTLQLGSQLIDSAVYTLKTFSLDTIQHIQIPVFEIQDGKRVPHTPEMDTLFLKRTVYKIPETLKVKEQTAFTRIPFVTDWIKWGTYGVIAFCILMLLLLTYAGYAKQWMRLQKLKRAHSNYLRDFKKAMQSYQQNKSIENTENVLKIWKQQVEFLLQIPISKLTTKELSTILEEESILESLHQFDFRVYGGNSELNLEKDAETLHQFAIQQYFSKIEAIKKK